MCIILLSIYFRVSLSTPEPATLKLSLCLRRTLLEVQFRTIIGREKPLDGSTEEHKSFIAREEFLMNQIVQRQGAAPPWVEIQAELEAAVTSFRAVSRQSWVRHAVRMPTSPWPPLHVHEH
jgi:DnaJ homolog subfamily C member 28